MANSAASLNSHLFQFYPSRNREEELRLVFKISISLLSRLDFGSVSKICATNLNIFCNKLAWHLSRLEISTLEVFQKFCRLIWTFFCKKLARHLSRLEISTLEEFQKFAQQIWTFFCNKHLSRLERGCPLSAVMPPRWFAAPKYPYFATKLHMMNTQIKRQIFSWKIFLLAPPAWAGQAEIALNQCTIDKLFSLSADTDNHR